MVISTLRIVPDGPNGHRRADGAPEGSQENKLVAHHATSELDREAC
jgi:hypothetical protein